MNLITKSASRATHMVGNPSLAPFKARAHRANRRAIARIINDVAKGRIDADEADFNPNRTHMVTAWEIT